MKKKNILLTALTSVVLALPCIFAKPASAVETIKPETVGQFLNQINGRDQYYKAQILGAGSFGEAYKVWNYENKKFYVVKRLKGRFSRNPILNGKMTNNFIAEGGFGLTFRGQLGIGPLTESDERIFDQMTLPTGIFGDHNGGYYSVLPYENGCNGKEYLNQKPFVACVDGFKNFKQVTEQLNLLHRFGFVHNDFKSVNTIIDVNRDLHLIDFGSTKKAGDFDLVAYTKLYAAPEAMATGGTQLISNPKMDVYSLGVTLPSLLFGSNGSKLMMGYNDQFGKWHDGVVGGLNSVKQPTSDPKFWLSFYAYLNKLQAPDQRYSTQAIDRLARLNAWMLTADINGAISSKIRQDTATLSGLFNSTMQPISETSSMSPEMRLAFTELKALNEQVAKDRPTMQNVLDVINSLDTVSEAEEVRKVAEAKKAEEAKRVEEARKAEEDKKDYEELIKLMEQAVDVNLE